MQKALMLVLAGVAIGMLLAPDKGSNTQRKVSNWLSGKTEDIKEGIEDATQNAQSKAKSVGTELKEFGNDLQSESRDKARSFS